jgi:pantoate--beta-alanine ligase
VIQTVVRDLNLPVDIVGVPTVREVDGLAMSSRNGYLTPQERDVAPQIYKILQMARNQIINTSTSFTQIQEQSIAILTEYGFVVDYFSVARRDDLMLASRNDNNLIILVAAQLGKTRLIDNLWIDK